MLKKLFISLIILSALTSDASAFSALMLSAGLSPECWLNQLEDSRILPDATGNVQAAAEEIIQSRTVQYRLIFVLPDSSYESNTNSSSCKIYPEEPDFNSLNKTFYSDPSPPFC